MCIRDSLPTRCRSMLMTIASIGAVVAIVCHMIPRFGGGGDGGGGGGANVNARQPPAWTPEHEHSYSSRAW
eukprot:2022535-Alexandrium_andersonii.AAC.1